MPEWIKSSEKPALIHRTCSLLQTGRHENLLSRSAELFVVLLVRGDPPSAPLIKWGGEAGGIQEAAEHPINYLVQLLMLNAFWLQDSV